MRAHNVAYPAYSSAQPTPAATPMSQVWPDNTRGSNSSAMKAAALFAG